MFDAHANFAISLVTIAPVPALTGTSLTVADSSTFPAAPFNCTVSPAGVQLISTNAEIVRVTAIVGNTFTIVRAQESSSAMPIAVGYQIANTTSVKVFTDIESAIPTTFVSYLSANGGSASAGIEFADANGISFGLVGNTMTASLVPSGGGSINFSAGTQSSDLNAITFSNSNGITFGLDNGTITAAHNGLTSQSNQAASASNGSFAFQTIGFSDANGISFGTSAGGIISASHNALTSQSNQAASASNGSFTFQTIGFSNANGVTFGTSAGGIITGSVGAGASPGSISAGTTSVALGQVVFSNSNNITFGLNGSTVTASASGGAAVPQISFWNVIDPVILSQNVNFSLAGYSKRPIFQPFWLPGESLGLNTVRMLLGRNGGPFNFTFGIAFYSISGGSRLNLHASTTHAVVLSATNEFTGIRVFDFTGMSNSSLSQGRWIMAYFASGSNNVTQSANFGLLGGLSASAAFGGSIFPGTDSTGASNAASLVGPFWGAYTNTSGGFPATVGSNEVQLGATNEILPMAFAQIMGTKLV